MRKLFPYFSDYKKECILGPLFKLLEASFELLVPLVVAGIVDNGIAAGNAPYIVKMALVMMGLGVVGLVCSVTAQYFAARAAVGFAGRLRHESMNRILSLSYEDMDRLGTSTMITRMTSDINQVQNGVNLTLRLLLRSPFVVFGAVFMAMSIDLQAGLTIAGTLPFLCVVVFGIMLITMPMYRSVQSKLDALTSVTRQNLIGVRILRAFNMEKQEQQEFRKKNRNLADGQTKAGRISSLMNPVTYVIVNLGVIVLIHVGALKVNSGVLTQGQVIALYNYISQILVELIKLANLIITITKAVAHAKRIEDLLSLTPSQEDGTDAPEQCAGQVRFCDVSAKYTGAAEPSLEHVSFTVQPGQTIGIIGGTGSGKTTLVNLIPRFYDVCSGAVLIDGKDVRTLQMRWLRQQIGIVPQKAVLFRGTIRENLRWGNPEASEQTLVQALDAAQAADIVGGREKGLDAPVEQGGVNLSGGQRQRLTIARALVRKPKILILDDSASALDFATDAALRKAIRTMENPPTTFLVSQRAASVRYADQILVLDDGKPAGIGTHEQLLRGCQTYQEIYYSQFSKEAEDNEI